MKNSSTSTILIDTQNTIKNLWQSHLNLWISLTFPILVIYEVDLTFLYPWRATFKLSLFLSNSSFQRVKNTDHNIGDVSHAKRLISTARQIKIWITKKKLIEVVRW